LAGGAPIPPPTLRQLRRKVGMVFQFHCLFEHLSALSNVCLAPVHAHGVAPANAAKRGRELLAAFGVEHRAAAYPRSSRAAKRSVWRSRAPWPSIRRCC
jgi:ABC-type polar amino acid transport system ATPase subunit